MNTFLIKNALQPDSLESVNIFVRDGIIEAIGDLDVDTTSQNIPEIDARGSLLLPGLFDLHAHLRQPGHEQSETVLSATEAAIQGGFTGLLAMGSDTVPRIDSTAMVNFAREKTRDARIPVTLSACITKSEDGEQQASYGGLVKNGVFFFSDGDTPPQNPLFLRRALQYAAEMNVIFALRGDIRPLTEKGMADESGISYSLGLQGIPACAEKIGVFQIMSLAEDVKAALHIQTLSTRGALKVFWVLKDRGCFSSEVALHHLIFDHSALSDFDTTMKVTPPLRDKSDVEALIEGVKSGIIDCIVSDHSPRTPFEKLQDFCSAPSGMIALDTFLPALFTHLVEPGKLSWTHVRQACSTNPRRILGLPEISFEPGSPANFVLFDPSSTTEVTPDFLKSKSRNTPWLHKSLKGKVMLVCHETVLRNEF